MSGDVVAEASVVDPVHEHIAWDLAERGWNVTDAYLEPALIAGLVSGSRALLQAGAFRPAGVGRGDALKLRPEVRSDQVLWLDPAGQDGAQAGYLQRSVGVNNERGGVARTQGE